MADEQNKHGHYGGHLLFTFGVLAIVYGLINYFMVLGWPSYTSWIVGGIILVLVAWVKKSMWKRK